MCAVSISVYVPHLVIMDAFSYSVNPFRYFIFFTGLFPMSLTHKNSKTFKLNLFGVIFSGLNFLMNLLLIVINITNKEVYTSSSSLLSIIWYVISLVDAIAVQIAFVYQMTKLQEMAKFFGLLSDFDDKVREVFDPINC